MAGIERYRDVVTPWVAKFGEEGRNNRHLCKYYGMVVKLLSFIISINGFVFWLLVPRLVGKPLINYDCLKMLCGIDGLGER